MERKSCKDCAYRDKREDNYVCYRYPNPNKPILKYLVKWVEGELVPDPDSKQFTKADGTLCDWQPKIHVKKFANMAWR